MQVRLLLVIDYCSYADFFHFGVVVDDHDFAGAGDESPLAFVKNVFGRSVFMDGCHEGFEVFGTAEVGVVGFHFAWGDAHFFFAKHDTYGVWCCVEEAESAALELGVIEDECGVEPIGFVFFPRVGEEEDVADFEVGGYFDSANGFGSFVFEVGSFRVDEEFVGFVADCDLGELAGVACPELDEVAGRHLEFAGFPLELDDGELEFDLAGVGDGEGGNTEENGENEFHDC